MEGQLEGGDEEVERRGEIELRFGVVRRASVLNEPEGLWGESGDLVHGGRLLSMSREGSGEEGILVVGRRRGEEDRIER